MVRAKTKYRLKTGVYLLVHRRSGDVYVGKGKNLADRPFIHFQNGKRRGNMKYYMEGNKPWERRVGWYLVVVELCSKKELGDVELTWFNYFDFKILINQCLPFPSGEGPSGTFDEKTLQNMRNFRKARKGHLHTPEFRQWMSETRTGEGHPMFGYKHSRESKQSNKEKHTAFNSVVAKPVRLTNRETGEVIEAPTAQDAAKMLGYAVRGPVKKAQKLSNPATIMEKHRPGVSPKKRHLWHVEYIPNKKTGKLLV